MAHGLEVRSPFLDHRLVEWAACLPLKAKLSGFTGKYILKKLAEKFLPKEVIYRRKQGFALPIPKWFREDLKDLVEDELFSKGMRESGIFNPQAMRRFYDEHLSGQRDWSQQLWALLALKYTYKSP
jgi:asparagine synthase (glutamine-hydrolysing)